MQSHLQITLIHGHKQTPVVRANDRLLRKILQKEIEIEIRNN